jgi:hypothetical protein
MISVTLYTLITLSFADLRLRRREAQAVHVQLAIRPSSMTPADRPEPGT